LKDEQVWDRLEDCAPEGRGQELPGPGKVVINATGAWSDDLRMQVGGQSRLRKLRGSHLILPSTRLPLSRAVSLQHPSDGRFIFAFPWEGVTLVGTTDIDHTSDLVTDPAISPEETEYLLEAIRRIFPDQEINLGDIQCTFSGIRPVIHTGKMDPSKETREHVLWCENGLLTVTGGKLTTFRLMAHDALKSACRRLPNRIQFKPDLGMLEVPPAESLLGAGSNRLRPAARLRLAGRYGEEAGPLLAAAQPEDLQTIEGTPSLWAELRWSAHSEGIVHLDDLLLRRVRLGLLLPEGGLSIIDCIRAVVQPELGWDDARWEQEESAYTRLWKSSYTVTG
jgi:glycerol-3-phosphate dehydrogenase